LKKAVLALVIAGSLIGGTTTGFAATKPTVKPAKSGAEGTASHEMSENSTTQKSEAKTTTKAKKAKHAKKAKAAKAAVTK